MHRKLGFRQGIFVGKYLCALAGTLHLVGCGAGQSAPQDTLGVQVNTSPGGGEEHSNSLKKEKVAVAQPKSVQQPEGLGSPVAEGNPTQGKSFTLPGLGMEMIWIQPGTFQMGSPEDEEERIDNEVQHLVEITRGFWLGKFEVTEGDYREIMNERPSSLTHVVGKFPVETVTWIMAVKFCAILTKRERDAKRLSASYEYGLPTEAQWEYACRAGTTTARYTEDLSEIAWFSENTNTVHEVGKKRPNAWGLHDMLGNVWELCTDWHGPYPEGPVKDPKGPDIGEFCIIRGGGWRGARAKECRAAYRRWISPAMSFNALGFRLCLRPVAETGK